MKARVKATGEVVEILPFVRDEYGYEYDFYDLDFTDWQAYRMEVAKECMAATWNSPDPQTKSADVKSRAEWAVASADALIARLKEQKDEQKDTDDRHEYMDRYYEPTLSARELSQKIARHLEGGWMLVATGKYDEQYDKYVFCKSKKGE